MGKTLHYRIALAWPAHATEPAPGVQPRIQQAMQEGLASQIEDLREQVRRFEALRAGEVAGIVVTSLLQ